MDNINPNLIIASNLYRLSALISVVAYFVVDPKPGVIAEALTIVLIIGVAHLIRRGHKWVKWTLLILEIIYLPFYIISIFTSSYSITLELLGAIVNLTQLAALVYLFSTPRQVIPDDMQSPEASQDL